MLVLAFNGFDQEVDDVAGFNQLFLAVTTVFVFDIVVVEVTVAQHDGVWDTDQFHIGKHHARTLFTIVHQHFDTLRAQLSVQLFSQLLHTVGFVHVHRQNGDLERGNGIWPYDATIVKVLFNSSSDYASDPDTVAAHSQGLVTAIFALNSGFHRFRVLGTQLEDVADFDTAFDHQRTFAVRARVAGDPSPDGKGTLMIKRGIEVGHIFQLGTKYSEAMKAAVQGEDGRNQTLTMGCYGIGVTRVVAAAIEQNFDDRGIVWPDAIAPFQVAILPMNMHKSYRVQELAEKLYAELRAQGIEVLMDDRKERPGVMFADMELIGIPHTIVLGDRNLDNDDIEYKYRRNGEKELIKTGDIVDFLVKAIKG